MDKLKFLKIITIMKKSLVIIFATLSLAGCKNANRHMAVIEEDDILVNRVLTSEEQQRLTPDQVISILKEGNEEFADNRLTVRNNTERVRDASLGQYPKAVILSCLDSRVPVEDVFHRGIGDVFVARVAGNIVNADILGSLEYACKVSGSKLVMVLGHEYCGAIKSAIDDVEMGNVTGLLHKIRPSVEQSRTEFKGEASSSNSEFVEHVCHTNVVNMVGEIRRGSDILREMEQSGQIKIIGGVYDMHTGVVDFYEDI